MSQVPRWYRKQLLEHQLKDTLQSPYADQATVDAARKAIDEKLDEQYVRYQRSQEKAKESFKRKLA